jgi:receptor tyrosine kinase
MTPIRTHKIAFRIVLIFVDQQDVEIDLDKLGSNASYHRHGASLNPKLEKLEFPRNNIIYIRDLGQGAFGRVFLVRDPFLLVL